MHAERRIVTTMFADISGFTAMAETMDPEAVRDVMNNCFERLVPIIEDYGGKVDKFIGDAIMALFGAPVALENDAERALRAALEMTAAVAQFNTQRGTDLGLHFGINTGLIIAGGIGSPGRQEYSVMGDAVNLASRLEDASERGEILVGPDTYRLTAPLFEFERLEPIKVKGKAEPVIIYRLVGEKAIRSRFAIAAERGLTPYVGRERELGLLKSYYERAKNRQGQVVFISGEAGIGKSRLLSEFQRAIRYEEVTWLEGQCISFRQQTPYLPFIAILKHAFGVEEGDNQARIIQRVEESTSSWEGATQATVPYLKFLLNVDPGASDIMAMDPRARRAGIFDGLRALLLQESRQGPLVLVVEDLHWIDEQSEAALMALVDVVATAPVLLLLSYRAGYSHSLGERTYFNRLVLGDLQPEESAALARGVLQVTELPAELGRLIAGKAEGNPFYIEEVIKSWQEAGVLREHNGSYELAQPVEQIQVPDTIQEVILSRIDHLQQDAKAALQLASVIGREFTQQLLGRISGLELQLEQVLEELKLLELIYQRAYFPERAYTFKHALTQAVAYSTLLRERRKALHRGIGAAIEELYRDRLVDQFEVLAYHYTEGEAWEKALDYLVKAGDKAAAAYANQDATSYYTRALEVCDELGDAALATSVDVFRRRGLVELNLADFDLMLVGARKLGDRHPEGMALAYRGLVEILNHDLEAAEGTLKTALDVAGEEFEDVRLFASVVLANCYLNFNRHAEARSYLRAAEELAPSVDDPLGLTWWSAVGMLLPNWEGCFKDALEHLARWRDTTIKYSFVYFNTQWFEALALGGQGEYQQALTLLEGLLAARERLYPGEAPSPVLLNTIGWLYGELQDPQRAMTWNRHGIEAAQEYTNLEAECNSRLNLGDNLLALGRPDEAEAHFQYVEQIVRDPEPADPWMIWRYSQHLFHSYGELWLMRGDYRKALSYADECLTLAEESNSRKNIIKGHRLRGQALMAQGAQTEAEQELSIALDVAQQVSNPPQLWKTHAALGDLRQAQGRPDEARQAYRDALAVIEKVASDLTDQSLRDTLLVSFHVQEIRSRL